MFGATGTPYSHGGCGAMCGGVLMAASHVQCIGSLWVPTCLIHFFLFVLCDVQTSPCDHPTNTARHQHGSSLTHAVSWQHMDPTIPHALTWTKVGWATTIYLCHAFSASCLLVLLGMWG
jgi:hypothetical protein